MARQPCPLARIRAVLRSTSRINSAQTNVCSLAARGTVASTDIHSFSRTAEHPARRPSAWPNIRARGDK